MPLRLRLMRFGKRNRPSYRVCAIDGRAPRDGAYIESIGTYDPFIEDDRKKVTIDKERAEYWLGVGAQPSETVASFLRAIHASGLSHPKKAPRKRPKRTGAKEKQRREKRVARKKERTAMKAKQKARAEARAKAEQQSESKSEG